MKDREVVKIGYAGDPHKRWRDIRIGNCFVELDDFKPGTINDEKQLHKLCNKWHVQGEWFTDCEEVREIWNNFESSERKEYLELLDKMKERNDYISQQIRKRHLVWYHAGLHKDEYNEILQDLDNKSWKIHTSEFKDLNIDDSYVEVLDRFKRLRKVLHAFSGIIDHDYTIVIDDCKYTFKVIYYSNHYDVTVDVEMSNEMSKRLFEQIQEFQNNMKEGKYTQEDLDKINTFFKEINTKYCL